MISSPLSRRHFLLACAGVVAASIPGRGLHAANRGLRWRGPHPTPRPGITAAKVLSAADLADDPDAIPAFDAVRNIPQIIDGIHCYCGCAEREGFYSLLSCYEGEGMARMCLICQGEVRLAERLHRQGRSLEDIRTAIDARYA